MARLREGGREEKLAFLLRQVRRFRWGIRERELAEELGWKRRTVNNYLHELERDGKVYREGRSWFAR